jgi:uncharacterized protein YcsI (UPF0317 family)
MGEYSKPTSGLCPGYAQANLVVLPKDLALDFMIFVQRNPKPCPVLDITEAGNPDPKKAAPGADIRTDIPLYRVYKKGELIDEPTDILSYWREDLVAFLLGCSFTFEKGLQKAGIPVRHIEEGCNVPMYITNIECMKGGIFQGPMVVSMRPIPGRLIPEAVRCTSRYPAVHGTPVHVGAPEEIGIKDIDKPDFGDRVTIKKGEIPVFWACGVTPQAVAMKVKPELMITHSPGHMFITDIREEELEI